MRSLGRVIAASLVGGCLFVGCVATPQTGRLAGRAPTELETTDALSTLALDVRAEPPVATTDAPVIASPSAPSPRASVSPAVRSARPARSTNSVGGASGPAARPVTPPAKSSPSAPKWERMHGEAGEGPFPVARAQRDGLPVSVNLGEEPAIHLGNPTPNGSPRVVLVVAEQGEWLKVLLPIRPNSSLGWVRKADVSISAHDYYVIVEQHSHRIRVYENRRLIVDEPVAVGRGNTPTPTGQFFTTDLLQPSNPNGAYGPYAFGLSGYSDVYQRFGNGDGVVGIHGTNDPSSVGRDASYGCIRVTNDVIRHLASFLPLGTPVAIRG